MIMILFEEVYSMARAIVRYLNAKGLRFAIWSMSCSEILLALPMDNHSVSQMDKNWFL